MKVKMKEMAAYKQCPMSYHLGKLNLVNEKGGSYHKAVAVKKVVKAFLKTVPGDREAFILSSKALLESYIPSDALNALSRNIEIEKLYERMESYLYWLLSEKALWVQGSAKRDIKVPGSNNLVEVSCDYILEMNGQLHVVQLMTRAPHLSSQGRSNDTHTNTSFELYLLARLGEEVTGRICNGAMHHLKPRGAKTDIPFSESKNVSFQKAPLVTDTETIILNLFNALKTDSKECNEKSCMNCNFSSLCGYKKKELRDFEEITIGAKANSEFKLTENQRKAVIFGDGVVRVNAGAGSGKTTIVALRVSELVIDGVFPENILLITFTNKGAGEMREKISYWLAKEGYEEEAKKLNIETFNSWGGKLIKKHFKELGFTEEPSLLNRVEKYDIIFDLLKRYPVMEGLNYEHPILNFPKAKGVVVYVAEMLDYIKSMGTMDLPSKTVHHEAIIKIFDEYNQILKDKNYIEYQDQIRLVNEAADNDYEFMSEYDYEHIICDEFQDTDSRQLDLILYLANQPKFKSLMIVGDDSQSIYGFRNTSQENILHFEKYFKTLNDIKLMENFRSTPEILNLANYINDQNVNKINKKLVPMASPGKTLPRLKVFKNDAEEVEFIAKDIESKIKAGRMPEEIAFIARTRNELFEMQQKLDELGIPSKIDVPEPLLKNPLLVPLKNIMDCVDNPDNTLGIADYLNITTEGFLDKDDAVIRKEIEIMKKELDALIDGTIIEEIDGVQKAKFLELAKDIQDVELALFIEEVERNNETFKEMKNYIDKFIAYEDSKVYTEKSEIPVRAVILITVHASKGKEYEVVYNSLRKYKGESSGEALEEERRTLFVSITRAKQELVLTEVIKSKKTSQLLIDIMQSACVVK